MARVNIRDLSQPVVTERRENIRAKVEEHVERIVDEAQIEPRSADDMIREAAGAVVRTKMFAHTQWTGDLGYNPEVPNEVDRIADLLEPGTAKQFREAVVYLLKSEKWLNKRALEGNPLQIQPIGPDATTYGLPQSEAAMISEARALWNRHGAGSYGTLSRIADETGLSIDVIRKRLQKAGVYKPRRYEKLTMPMEVMIQTLAKSGFTPPMISEAMRGYFPEYDYEFPTHTLQAYLRRNGIVAARARRGRRQGHGSRMSPSEIAKVIQELEDNSGLKIMQAIRFARDEMINREIAHQEALRAAAEKVFTGSESKRAERAREQHEAAVKRVEALQRDYSGRSESVGQIYLSE